jgi:hypothetical protein
MNDLTVIYLTANRISEKFMDTMQTHLLNNIGVSTPLITVTKKHIPLGHNIITTGERSHVGIYRDALVGAKAATTRFIAIAEDDVLYSPEHFKKRPSSGRFAYNMTCWQLYTWQNPPIYSHSGRRNFGQLICERELFITALEERFAKYPDETKVNNAIWAEPGKYESQLGVTVRETEMFYTDPANIMFTHEDGLSMGTLGKKKRLSPIRAWDVPFWGRADKIIKMYE